MTGTLVGGEFGLLLWFGYMIPFLSLRMRMLGFKLDFLALLTTHYSLLEIKYRNIKHCDYLIFV